MRPILYILVAASLILLGFQIELVRLVWFGPKENRIYLMGIPMLAPFVFLSAAATIALASRIETKESTKKKVDGKQTSTRFTVRTIQRFAMGVAIVQALLFLAG